MINVNSIQPPVGPEGIEPAGPVGPGGRAMEASGAPDVVEISLAARLAAQIHSIPDVRTELVQCVKAEIAAGTYETKERIEHAVSRLMDELFVDF